MSNDFVINLKYHDRYTQLSEDPTPTGRWKIINNDGESTMLVEFCEMYNDKLANFRAAILNEDMLREKGQWKMFDSYDGLSWWDCLLIKLGAKDRLKYTVFNYRVNKELKFDSYEDAKRTMDQYNEAIRQEIREAVERERQRRVHDLGWFSEHSVTLTKTFVNCCGDDQ
jgi:hypothetical protein